MEIPKFGISNFTDVQYGTSDNSGPNPGSQNGRCGMQFASSDNSRVDSEPDLGNISQSCGVACHSLYSRAARSAARRRTEGFIGRQPQGLAVADALCAPVQGETQPYARCHAHKIRA
eukprot:COSAG02_NODE_381_length_23450_cov_65.782493_16_plen_117_part_00